MIFERRVVGPLHTNCYLLGDPTVRQAVVIDPGGEGDRLARRIEELGMDLTAVLLTHAHPDHIKDAWYLKNALGGKIHLHEAEKVTLVQSLMALNYGRVPDPKTIATLVDVYLSEETPLRFGSILVRVIETPGHTPGHVSFHVPAAAAVFVGDTLFAGSIGRTDFPGGSFNRLIRSVLEKIFPLDGKTTVYPGHGPETTIEGEIRTNPFFSGHPWQKQYNRD